MSPEGYAALRMEGVFLAEDHRFWRGKDHPRSMGELEFQGGIYGGAFGVEWRGEDGEKVVVRHFGNWNREPGPDFCGACVEINGEVLTGDIEVDPEVRDWEGHGHAVNKDFGQVILHIFLRRGSKRFFTRTWEGRAVTQVCLDPGQPVKRTAEKGETLPAEKTRELVEAAGGFRLRQKIEAFRRAEKLSGRDQAVFQGLATGLGYKNNKVPFLLVAQRCGVERAAQEHLLFGLAGFLRAKDFDEGDDDVKDYLAPLWDEWWAVRDRETRLVLPAEAWKFAALRPANHPHRRMGALAQVAKSFRRVMEAVENKNIKQFREALTAVDHPYWRRHASLARDPLPRATALIGEDRALDLVINVLLPSMPEEDALKRMAELAGPTPSQKILKAAEWLGEGPKSPLLKSALHQQGLLQLHADFFPQSPQKIWEGQGAR